MDTFIFDNDGTLLDSEKIYYKTWQAMADKYGFDFDLGVKKIINGKNFDETTDIISEKFGFSKEKAKAINLEMNQMRSDLINNHQGSLYKPYTIELLTYLKEKGYKPAMATASSMDRLDSLYGKEEIDARKFFDLIVTGDQVKECKPNPMIFNKTMELLGSKPENTFVLEDSNTGIRAARLSKAKAVLILDLDQSDGIKADADLVFESFKEFHDYLKDQGL